MKAEELKQELLDYIEHVDKSQFESMLNDYINKVSREVAVEFARHQQRGEEIFNGADHNWTYEEWFDEWKSKQDED